MEWQLYVMLPIPILTHDKICICLLLLILLHAILLFCLNGGVFDIVYHLCHSQNILADIRLNYWHLPFVPSESSLKIV